MTEKEQKNMERQLKLLQEVYETWMPTTPVFKPNHVGVPEGSVPYISTSDVHDYKYNIRIVPFDVFFSNDGSKYEETEKGKIISHYDSLEELVADGWELD